MSKTLTSPRRGLNPTEAATYVGIGSTKFAELVAAKIMPRPRVIGTRKVFDVTELDAAFDNLPHEGAEAADTWADLGSHKTQTR